MSHPDHTPAGETRTTADPGPRQEEPTLDDGLALVDRWWRAANYLSVGQIYLRSNPLLRRPLQADDTKSRLLGHWGTTPGLNFVYAHLNRVIRRDRQEMLFIAGPGHGGPAVVANGWLEGTYSETYDHVGDDERGMAELFRQFSYPGGVPSHAAPETPGSISEGGELGYSLAHAYGSVFDNPQLITAVVIGDGEAETGPLAASWHSHNFLDPVADGAVLPILHLNGYKIANPTILARMPERQLEQLLRGYGHEPYFVSVEDPADTAKAHRAFAAALDDCLTEVRAIQAARRAAPNNAASNNASTDAGGTDARWPMIVLRSPKGWTGPRTVDGLQVEGTWRSHQVPLSEVRTNPEHLSQLESWLASYRPDELFDEHGRLRPDVAANAPSGGLRMSATAHANGGVLLRSLALPDYAGHAVEVGTPGVERVSPMVTLGRWLRDVIADNPDNFLLFGPDETASNRLQDVFDVSDKVWESRIEDVDEHLAPTGRVREVLSEHLCQGWLEGYLLTGRHGIFNCYEAFIHIVDSMFNQHAKWLKVHRELPWRRPVASLNYLLSSHVWQQDHNGFSHQDPGFIDHAVNKKAEIIRVYLPPDANTLLAVMDHCLRSRDYVNIVVSGKQPSPTWLTPTEAEHHSRRGLGIWDFAGTEIPGEEPDVVLACAGDVPTIETVAAARLLADGVPDLKIRVVNVVDLMRLQADSEHPHGLAARDFEGIFTADKPIIFAYHGYPALIHRLTYRHGNQERVHVRGYTEEGTTTTPFDMAMLNGIDRFQLAIDVIDRVEGLRERHSLLRQSLQDRRMQARDHTREHGEDPEEIRNWTLA